MHLDLSATAETPGICNSRPVSQRRLLLAWLLGIAGHDLDLVRCEFVGAFCLEFDVLDEESPHIVTESVCFQVSLMALVS